MSEANPTTNEQPPDGAMNAEMVVTVAAAVTDGDLEIIDSFVEETNAALQGRFNYYEILLIDHGADDTLAKRVEELQKSIPNVRLVRLSRAYDEEVAFFAALDCSIGDYVVLMDANFDPPGRVPDLIEQCSAGYDAVIGRTADKGKATFLRRPASRIFYRVLGAMTGQSIDPSSTNFRVFSRRIVNSIVRIKSKNLYMKYLTEYVGYKQTHLEYERINRSDRNRDAGIMKSVNMALNVIIANSNRPLRIAAFVGLGASFMNLLYIVFILGIHFLRPRVSWIDAAQGWASTNLFAAVMFFLLFSMLAVLSEYVLKILEEAQDRPLYYIAYESNSSVVDQYRESINVV